MITRLKLGNMTGEIADDFRERDMSRCRRSRFWRLDRILKQTKELTRDMELCHCSSIVFILDNLMVAVLLVQPVVKLALSKRT